MAICLFPPSSCEQTTRMNPIYSPAPAGVPFPNTKGLGYPGKVTFRSSGRKNNGWVPVVDPFSCLAAAAGFPVGYAAAPAYTPSVYAGANPAFASGKNEP